jgi:hypothetical protein
MRRVTALLLHVPRPTFGSANMWLFRNNDSRHRSSHIAPASFVPFDNLISNLMILGSGSTARVETQQYIAGRDMLLSHSSDQGQLLAQFRVTHAFSLPITTCFHPQGA